MDYFDASMRGLSVGVLIGFILLYVLRPREPYPHWTLVPFEQPWLLIVFAIVLMMAFKWDTVVGTLILISMIGILLDVLVYGKQYVPKDINSPLRTTAKEASLSLDAGVASPRAVFSGMPLAETDIRFDLPVPQYPMFAGMYGPQPGEPSLSE